MNSGLKKKKKKIIRGENPRIVIIVVEFLQVDDERSVRGDYILKHI